MKRPLKITAMYGHSARPVDSNGFYLASKKAQTPTRTVPMAA